MSFAGIQKYQIVLILLSFLSSLIYFFSLPFAPYAIDFVFKGASILLIGIFSLVSLTGSTRFFTFISFLFSTAGDVFLTFVDEKYFLIGLSNFFFAHLFYIFAFFTLIKRPIFLNSFQKKIIPLIFLSALSMFLILRPYLNELKMPVIIYMGVLVIMLTTATLIQTTKNKLILTGTFLFVISDSLLSLTKFITPFFGGNQLVWITYYAAQICIAFGIVKINNQ